MKVLSKLVTQTGAQHEESGGKKYPTLEGTNTGAKIFVQNSDPAASATNGDIWIQIP